MTAPAAPRIARIRLDVECALPPTLSPEQAAQILTDLVRRQPTVQALLHIRDLTTHVDDITQREEHGGTP